MATHSSILAWKIPQKEEPGGLQSRVHKESDRTEHACFKNSNNKRSISIGDTRPPHCHKTTDQHASQVKPQPPSVPAASRGGRVSGPANDQNLGTMTICKLCVGNTMGLGWGTKRVK